MRISIAYNLQTVACERQAELLNPDDVARISTALDSLGHEATPVEVTGDHDEVADRIVATRPDLIFNVAEGTGGTTREAFYPSLFEVLGIPYTGGSGAILFIDQDKHLTEHILELHGIRVPRGGVITPESIRLPAHLAFPLFLKPNYEGSSKGISVLSVVESREEFEERIPGMLAQYPEGILVEEFIAGRELSVPMLEGYPGKLLPPVEYVFDLEKLGRKHNVVDYQMKATPPPAEHLRIVCPAELTDDERRAVEELAERVFALMKVRDFGRVDVRLGTGGPCFIEINPLASLRPAASLMRSAATRGLSYQDVIAHIVNSAARRFNLPRFPVMRITMAPGNRVASRPTAREVGITVGRFPPGQHNAITDVQGVQVGHATIIQDDVPLPGGDRTTAIRTGITAILPTAGDFFNEHCAAGGFILNGVGEMAGITQLLEWGWLETPIMLTNTLSVGDVHSGVITYMLERYPDLGTQENVIIPVVGETNDQFLNDYRICVNTPARAIDAIKAARGGPVPQGSVGAGTGLTTMDFAGGIGSSSRIIRVLDQAYTVGVLVQSNFGKMRNLTVEGAVVGRDLDRLYPYELRRGETYGSIIVIVATDAPLLTTQLNHLSKRAALGLGRAGSHARATSGEIIIAFSNGNKSSRAGKAHGLQTLCYFNEEHASALYEAVIEATEEAVLNAMFCSAGMDGRADHYCPPIPVEEVIRILDRGRGILPLRVTLLPERQRERQEGQ